MKKSARGQHLLGVPSCQGRVRTKMGFSTEAGTKVQLVAELWPRRGAPEAPGPFGVSGDPLIGQLGKSMFKKLDLTIPM